MSLRPDLAIVLPSQAEAAAKLGRAGIATLTVDIESVEDVARAARTVGERCGAAEAGQALAERLTEELAPRPDALEPGAPRRGATGDQRTRGLGGESGAPRRRSGSCSRSTGLRAAPRTCWSPVRAPTWTSC